MGCLISIIYFLTFACTISLYKLFRRFLKCPMLAFLYAYFRPRHFICSGPRYSDCNILWSMCLKLSNYQYRFVFLMFMIKAASCPCTICVSPTASTFRIHTAHAWCLFRLPFSYTSINCSYTHIIRSSSRYVSKLCNWDLLRTFYPRILTLLYLSRVNSDPGWLKNR